MYNEDQRHWYMGRAIVLRAHVDHFISDVNTKFPDGVPDMPTVEREIDSMMVALIALKDKTYGVSWKHRQPWVKRLRKFLGYTYP